jgi:hypothetical protein
MKRNFKIVLIAALLVTAPLLMLAQAPPHPNGGAAPSGTNGNGPVGGGAPVGSGVVILIAMGAAYGARRLYQMRNTIITEE